MMHKQIVAPLAAFMALSSNPAVAQTGDQAQTREIYRDTLTVRMANGSNATALLVFSITGVSNVGQRGNAKFPDNRSCYHDSIRRSLVRSLTLITADGTQIPVRDTMVTLPDAPGYSWTPLTPCNRKQGEIASHISDSLGNSRTWQSYIDGERSKTERIISQFGQVLP